MRLTDLSDTELYFHLVRLQAEYVQCIDDDRLEAWPDFFTDPCVYRIVPRENSDRGLPLAALSCDSRGMLVDRVVSLRHANIYGVHYYRHLTGELRVLARDAESVSVQSHYAVFQTRGDGTTSIYQTGKYLDRVVVDQGALRYREKLAVFDTYRIDSLLVRPI